MNREDDLKNLWRELREINEAKGDDEEKAEEPAPKETVELDALLSRLEDIVSRLEEALGKKDDSKKDEKGEDREEEEPKKEEVYIPRRVRRPLRSRYNG